MSLSEKLQVIFGFLIILTMIVATIMTFIAYGSNFPEWALSSENAEVLKDLQTQRDDLKKRITYMPASSNTNEDDNKQLKEQLLNRQNNIQEEIDIIKKEAAIKMLDICVRNSSIILFIIWLAFALWNRHEHDTNSVASIVIKTIVFISFLIAIYFLTDVIFSQEKTFWTILMVVVCIIGFLLFITFKEEKPAQPSVYWIRVTKMR